MAPSREWLDMEEIDEDMILPICQELQAKTQAVANRVQSFTNLKE